MKKKTLNSIVVIIIAVLGYFFADNKPETSPKSEIVVRDSRISLTKHARCRMDCRKIDMSEVKLALDQGKINHQKSEPRKKPCPVYAREVFSKKDKQKIRVVSADCKDESTIITVIDLTTDHHCFCK